MARHERLDKCSICGATRLTGIPINDRAWDAAPSRAASARALGGEMPPRFADLYVELLQKFWRRFDTFATAECAEGIRREFLVRGEHAGETLLKDLVQILDREEAARARRLTARRPTKAA